MILINRLSEMEIYSLSILPCTVSQSPRNSSKLGSGFSSVSSSHKIRSELFVPDGLYRSFHSSSPELNVSSTLFPVFLPVTLMMLFPSFIVKEASSISLTVNFLVM